MILHPPSEDVHLMLVLLPVTPCEVPSSLVRATTSSGGEVSHTHLVLRDEAFCLVVVMGPTN